jgi:hypothetical protein
MIPVRLLTILALGELTAGSAIAWSLIRGLVVAGLAAADGEGMAKAELEWKQIGTQLDNMTERITNAQIKARADWIAEDRDAFDNAVTDFKTKIGDGKNLFDNCGTAIGLLGKAVGLFWIYAAALAAVTLGVLIALAVLFAIPFVNAGAKAAAETVGNVAATLVNVGTTMLGKTLAIGAGVVSALATLVLNGMAFGSGGPDAAKNEFKEVGISWTAPTARTAPRRELPAPAN